MPAGTQQSVSRVGRHVGLFPISSAVLYTEKFATRPQTLDRAPALRRCACSWRGPSAPSKIARPESADSAEGFVSAQRNALAFSASPARREQGRARWSTSWRSTTAERARRSASLPSIPTSPYTGGAILGDRIRMQEHHADPGIYIRSMATRGSLGGLARTTADVATVLDASGTRPGSDRDRRRRAGRSRHRAPGRHHHCDSGAGHGRRCADHQGRHHGDRRHFRHQQERPRRRRDVSSARFAPCRSLAMRKDGWTPPIVKTVASDGKGIEELAATIRQLRDYLQKENLAPETQH